MKVIVVRQPWAWLIIHGGKDIENRSWVPRYRGPLLIQASAALPRASDLEWVRKRRIKIPKEFERGGIVGMVEFEDYVTSSRSKWFTGPNAWVLRKPRKLPFVALKGRLGLFDAPPQVIAQLRRARPRWFRTEG
jgi:hypothetical protein